MTSYRICVRCIMDTSDPSIAFDGGGMCHHCKTYDQVLGTGPIDTVERQRELEASIDRIKRDGRGKPFDCVAGISGGVDSTYVVWLAKQYGLRPLAVHLDNGWNSEISVGNIHRALEKLGIELFTKVLDWDEFRDLQVSFLKASTPDSEIPTDHAIIATVFKTAWSKGIKHLVLGHNKATELVLPPAWSQGHFDWRYIRGVQARFGTRRLVDFPHLAFPNYVRYRLAADRSSFNILNFVDYSRSSAIDVLKRELDWRDYGGKHHESVYTRFFQASILPRKFGFDKRRAHLSNQVLAGQLSRKHALEEINKPPYATPQLEKDDREYVIKKLGLTEESFEELMKAPPRRYEDYPNMYNSRFYLAARHVYRSARAAMGRRAA